MAIPTSEQVILSFSLAEPLGAGIRREWKADLRDISTKAEIQASGTFDPLVVDGNIPIRVGDFIKGYGSDGLILVEIITATIPVTVSEVSAAGPPPPPLVLSRGSLAVTIPAATTVPGVGTFVKVQGTTGATSVLDNFTHTTDNELTYVGGVTKEFKVTSTISYTATAGKLFALAVAKNGIVETLSEQEAQDESQISVEFILNMFDPQIISIFVANKTDTTSFTANFMNFIVTQVQP